MKNLVYAVPAITVFVWACFQATDKATAKWTRRSEWWSFHVGPVWRHVKADARALHLDFRWWRAKRRGM